VIGLRLSRAKLAKDAKVKYEQVTRWGAGGGAFASFASLARGNPNAEPLTPDSLLLTDFLQ